MYKRLILPKYYTKEKYQFQTMTMNEGRTSVPGKRNYVHMVGFPAPLLVLPRDITLDNTSETVGIKVEAGFVGKRTSSTVLLSPSVPEPDDRAS